MGTHTTASQIAGLTFGVTSAPYNAAYPNQAQYPGAQPTNMMGGGMAQNEGDKYAGYAKWMAAAGLLCCPVFSLIGIGMGIAAIQKGSPKGRGAIITCVITLIAFALMYPLMMYLLQQFGGGGI